MDKKVFRIGQLVYAVISAELLGLAIKGVTIVPVTIVSQTDKGVYGIKIHTYADAIVSPMEIERLFGSIAEANESQMVRLNTISADLKTGQVSNYSPNTVEVSKVLEEETSSYLQSVGYEEEPD